MELFGRYRLVRKVATGGMAEVWKAKAEGPAGFEKILAIKKVLPDLAEDPGFVAMFVDEAKIAASLVHPNIVQVFDFGQVGPDYFIAMEYVAGVNMARLLTRLGETKGKLPPEVALHLAIETLKGLGHAHAKVGPGGRRLEIVHRDVSPHNLLLSFDGELKITDFGIAKVADAVGSKTLAGQLRGKLAYMSPEQAASKSLDRRSDLFSLGLVLYEMLTGRRILLGPPEVVLSRLGDWTGPTGEELAVLPAGLRAVLEKALARDPAERFQEAREFEGEIESFGGASRLDINALLSQTVRKLFPEDERKEVSDEEEEVPTQLGIKPIPGLAIAPPPEVSTEAGVGAAVPLWHPEALEPPTNPTPKISVPGAAREGTQTLAASGTSRVREAPWEGSPREKTGSRRVTPSRIMPAPAPRKRRKGLYFVLALVLLAASGAVVWKQWQMGALPWPSRPPEHHP